MLTGKTGKPDEARDERGLPENGTVPGEQEETGLDEFFASGEEIEAIQTMSLDLYRDEVDARLRLEGYKEYLTFRLGDEWFAAEIYNIKEIIKVPPITPVPRTNPVILGVMSLRGTISPVMDLKLRLGLGSISQTRQTRILVIDIEGDLMSMMVDSVVGVIRLRESAIEPRPAMFDRKDFDFILGVGRFEGQMYTLIDLKAVAVAAEESERA